MHLPEFCVAFGLPPVLLSQVHAALAPSTNVQEARSPAALARALQATPDACLLLAVPSEIDLRVVDELQRLQAWHPTAPALALFLHTSCPAGILHFGRAGIKEILDVSETVDVIALRAALHRCYAEHVAATVWDEVVPHIPASLAPLLRTALQLASHPTSAGALAAATSLPERTLRQRCVQAGLPSPRWIVAWARVLLTDYYLRQSHCSMREVSVLLHYPSVSAMRQQLRRFALWPWSPRGAGRRIHARTASDAARARRTPRARPALALEIVRAGRGLT